MRLRYLVQINPPKSQVAHLPGDTEVVFAPMQALADGLGGLDVSMIRPLAEVSGGSYSFFCEGDLLLAKVTPCFENGKKAIATGLPTPIGFATSEVHVIRLKSETLDRRYLNYVFCSDHFRFVGAASMTGAGGLRRVPEETILNYRLPVSDLPTQKRIADLLGHETARIDQLMEKKQKLIEVLEEKSSNTITRAVTKGLDQNALMKASRLPWLVKVPAHWDVYPLKWLASLKSGDSITSDYIEETGEYPVFGGNGLRGYTSVYNHSGTHVLIGRQGALCGNINYACGKFFASEHAIVVTPVRQVEISWLGELLRTMNLNQYSMSAAQPGLSVGTISNLSIPVPPLSEQHAIADYIARETIRMDAAVSKISESIKTLRELRSSIITAAVTGQIDVDTWRKRGDTDRRLEAIEEEANI